MSKDPLANAVTIPEKNPVHPKTLDRILKTISSETGISKEVKLKDKVRELKTPLQLEVNYYDEEYVVTNKDIGLRVISKTMKDALEGISEQIDSLWSAYVEADTSRMNAGAKELRKKLISLFEGGT
jgi:hypothetical protein